MLSLNRTPLFLLLSSLALSFFWILPAGRALFYPIDVQVALFCHNFLNGGPFVWNFFACLNSFIGDWIFDLVIFIFFFSYCASASTVQEKKSRILTFLLLISYFFIVYIWYGYLFNKAWKISSPSPSLVLPDFVYLSDLVSWIHVKDRSSRSYPSGHGNTIFLFWISISILQGKKTGFTAFIASIPFLLPRLVVGAHWLSDYLFGSLPLALFNLALLFYTPPFYRMIYDPKRNREELPKTL